LGRVVMKLAIVINEGNQYELRNKYS